MNESEDMEMVGGHLSSSETSSKRSMIDQEVYSWVLGEQVKGKVCTGNMVRQKAYEIGRNYDPYFKASINWYTKWKKRYDYEESPEANALKNRKRSYTAAFKLYAVQRASELLSVSQASLELNVSRRCLQRWREEIDIINSVAEKAANAVYRRPGQGRKVADSSLDGKLVEWVDKAWKNGDKVTTNSVRQKAKELSSNPDFKASLGWYVKWQRRHKINLKDRSMDSPILKSTDDARKSPLKLRLLPDGQSTVYTSRPKALQKRSKRDSPEATSQRESNDEFDRLLLTWLVEQWEVGETVNEKMLRDKATELTTNPEFRSTRTWMSNWKEKYNVSLDNQTYGTAGEAEGEIVEESQVYDELTLHDSATLTSKEEAATALASLAAEGPSGGLDTSTGMEIAVALQKIATAIGLQANTGDALQQLQLPISMEQSTTLLDTSSKVTCPSGSNALATLDTPTTPYLVVGGDVHVGAEEVVSEEVITDDPLVVVDDSVPSQDNIVTVQSGGNCHTVSSAYTPPLIPPSGPTISNICSLDGLQTAPPDGSGDVVTSISSPAFSTSSLSQLIETLSNAPPHPPIASTLYHLPSSTVVYSTRGVPSLVEPTCTTVPIETEVVIAEDSTNPQDPSVLLQSEVVDWDKVAGLFDDKN